MSSTGGPLLRSASFNEANKKLSPKRHNNNNHLSPRRGSFQYTPPRRDPSRRSESNLPQQETTEDVAGECLWQLINRNELFTENKKSTTSTQYDNKHQDDRDDYYFPEDDVLLTFRVTPLLSRHNFCVIRQWALRLFHTLYQFYLYCFSVCNRASAFLSRDNNTNRNNPKISETTPVLPKTTLHGIIRSMVTATRARARCTTVWHSLFFLLYPLLPASMLFLAVTGTAAVVWSTQMLFFLLSWICVVLIDWQDVQNIVSNAFPPVLVSWSTYVGRKINTILFQSNRYSYRVWNEEEFVQLDDDNNSFVWWSSQRDDLPASDSRKATLWESPPPTVTKRRNGDTTTKQQQQQQQQQQSSMSLPSQHHWSQGTKAHMAAIDYCYIMLKEDYNHKKLKRRKALERSMSSPAISPRKKKNISRPRKSIIGSGVRSNSSRAVLSWDTSHTIIKEENDEHDDGEDENADKEVEVIAKHQQNSIPPPKSFTEDNRCPSSPREAIELEVKQRNKSVVEDTSFYSDKSDGRGYCSSEGFFSDDDDYTTTKDDSGSVVSADADLPWLDVGVKVGMRLLNSAHVQRAMASQETTDRLMGIGANFASSTAASEANTALTATSESFSPTTNRDAPNKRNNNNNTPKQREATSLSPMKRSLPKPMHPMWTSPAAAASGTGSLNGSCCSMEHEDILCMSDRPLSPINRSRSFPSSPERNSAALPPLSPDSRRGSIGRKRYSASNSQPAGRKLSSSSSRRLSWRKSEATARKEDIETMEDDSIEATIRDVRLMPPPEIPRVQFPKNLENAPLAPITTPSKKKKSQSGRSKSDSGLGPTMYADAPPLAVKEKSPKRATNKRGEPKFRRAPLKPGVKVAVPLFPFQPEGISPGSQKRKAFLMATVVSSKRTFVEPNELKDLVASYENGETTNCLSVTVKLEQYFLRNGEFGELTFRVMDSWGPRYMPRHSKVPIGSCVATSYGIGVLVGWRIEDDCHVIRSLWQRRGSGSAHAYLNRNAIHSTIEAAVGFRVQTSCGWGVVLACVDGGRTFNSARFFVVIKEEGLHKGKVLEFDRHDILSCHGAQFIPVIEHIREAAQYQMQIDNYYAALREQRLDQDEPTPEEELLRSGTVCAEILWTSFLKAVEEDKDFDNSVNDFMNSIIEFLERLDEPSIEAKPASENLPDAAIEVQLATGKEEVAKISGYPSQEPGFWIMNDLFGGVFISNEKQEDPEPVKREKNKTNDEKRVKAAGKSKHYERAFALLRILMKTVSIARAASVDHPHFRLALAICYDFLLFVKTIIKVQQKNISVQSLDVWKCAWEEIVSTFGPLKERLEKIGQGIAQRMQAQGRKAKIRLLRFVDKILGDERVIIALEQGEWDKCLERLEIALVDAHVIQEENLVYYRKAAKFVHDHIRLALENDGGAATRNSEKLALLAKAIQSLASPRRSVLKLFQRDDVLELFERILVRAYYKEEVATRMLTIHAANFHSLRHLRMLKDMSVAGRIWIPLLDAADEEFSWLVSKLPENSKDFMCPLSSLFSLCVVQFHKMDAGDLSKDWLGFLLEEDSARIIHDLDMKLILALESFSRDIREMMVVLPYYPSIDDDILNLMDEVDLDEFLKDASDAMDDPDLLSQFVREKATIGIERFLNYLPKMSIPVEKRDLGEGWVLTCHGEDGGDLTLTDVNIKRENLVCQIMGGDSLFFPMFGDEEAESIAATGSGDIPNSCIDLPGCQLEESILDHIRDLILNAQKYGCWKAGVGGVGQPPSDRYVAAKLHGLPISTVLNCAIELWRNLELDDDELLEIAIRDISYQIKLQKEREEGLTSTDVVVPPEPDISLNEDLSASSSFGSTSEVRLKNSSSSDSTRHRFNPRVDPTVLHLEIKSLKLNLNNFIFRIEKGEKKNIFDPVFEGRGMVSLENVSIRLRVEVAKERVKTSGPVEVATPILQLRELQVSLDKLKMKVKDTGFGSDWILNKAVDVFEESITRVVEDNLKEQILEQAKLALENLNSYFLMNPSMLLNILGISMEDLDENVVWV